MINGKNVKEALVNSYACLTNEKEKIDSLNVFPVPDGDTGTNMLLTYTSGIEGIINEESESVSEILKKFSRGLLMGARGNSGVILSQIFRGLSKAMDGMDSVEPYDFVESLVEARDTAYKAVMNPVEGTILTVINDMSRDVYKYKNMKDIKEIMDLVVEEGEKSLENTPNLLPVLKEAGVVDSGGYGLLVIFKGIRDYFYGNLTEVSNKIEVFDSAQVSGESTEFGYCTEFIIELDSNKQKDNMFSETKIKQQLNKIGDSLVVVHDDDIVKVHVHTLVPGEALNIGQKYGEFLKLKIENMTIQHEEIIRREMEETKSKYAIIAVSPGEGISDVFRSLNVTHVIEGGQTMNPSTQDFANVIQSANVENVIILPNNSNIIMAANQAKALIEESSDVKVSVIETKSIIQCLASLSFFNELSELEDNVEEMTEAFAELKYGDVTFAVRDTVMNDVEVKKDEYISIFNKKIIKSSKEKFDALEALVAAMVDEDTSVITVVYGSDVTEAEVKDFVNKLEAKFDDHEFEIHNGKQDIYSYFIGVE